MAKVITVGGVFFKSKDSKALGDWYRQWLGMPVEHPYGASMPPKDLPAGSLTVWAPFVADTDYFQPSEQAFMINLIVDDLDGALEQVENGGGERIGKIEDYEYGRFGWFLDPEGNKVELWEPKDAS